MAQPGARPRLRDMPNYQAYLALGERPKSLGEWTRNPNGEYVIPAGELFCRATENDDLCFVRRPFAKPQTLHSHVRQHNGAAFEPLNRGELAQWQIRKIDGYYRNLMNHVRSMEDSEPGDAGFRLFQETPWTRQGHKRQLAADAAASGSGPLDSGDGPATTSIAARSGPVHATPARPILSRFAPPRPAPPLHSAPPLRTDLPRRPAAEGSRPTAEATSHNGPTISKSVGNVSVQAINKNMLKAVLSNEHGTIVQYPHALGTDYTSLRALRVDQLKRRDFIMDALKALEEQEALEKLPVDEDSADNGDQDDDTESYHEKDEV
ncbi:hypothetical protein F5Y15DRAFT_417016 [Xylariaceae sp. FL0016]|nr:hypothetical protein F5Y15DRAFT_417016 [Xylariaceae sp. FL0016]